MSDTKTVGDFKATISSPHPVWIRLHYRDQELPSFKAEELPDLEYLIQWAKRIASGKSSEPVK